MSKSMRLVFFTLPGLIVRFNWRFPIGTHRSSASHACNRAADHFIVQPCPHAVGVVIDRAVFTNTKMLCRLDGVNIGAEEQEFPTILTLIFASFGRLLSDNSMKGASKDACASGFLRMCDVRKTRSLQHESRNCIPVDLPWTCRCYTAY